MFLDLFIDLQMLDTCNKLINVSTSVDQRKLKSCHFSQSKVE